MAVRRHGLMEAEWRTIAPLLPPPSRLGRHRRDDRQMVEGILWRTRTGAPWRDLPERFGPWETVYTRFNQWTKAGVWERILQTLRGQVRARGDLSETWYIDGTNIRATRAASGGGKKGAPTSRLTTRSGNPEAG